MLTGAGTGTVEPFLFPLLLVTQCFGGVDPRGLAGREEGREQRGHVGEGDDHAQGAPWHRVADTGDLLREGVDDPDREGGAEGHAETDAEQISGIRYTVPWSTL